MAHEWDRERGKKRGGGATMLSLDFEIAETVGTERDLGDELRSSSEACGHRSQSQE